MNDTTIVLRRRPGPRSWLALGAAAAAVLVMLLLIAVACQAANRTGDNNSAPPPPTSTQDGSPTATGDGTGDNGGDGSGSGSGQNNGGQNSGGQDGGGQDGGGQNGGGQQPTAPPGPVIDYFRVAQQPSCPGGTNQAPTEGSPVVLEWRVTGTDQVSLSIDGPGVYDTYPAEGSATINFPCEGHEGDIQRHTYLLTATNADGTTTRELVVEATVHERTQV